ncbi:MAG: hypothetical protein ABSC95_10830 [Acetobacteraceae bacterium]
MLGRIGIAVRAGAGSSAAHQAIQPLGEKLRLVLFDQGKDQVLVKGHALSALICAPPEGYLYSGGIDCGNRPLGSCAGRCGRSTKLALDARDA